MDMTEEWEQIARDAWTRAESGDQRSAINEYAMDWLQRLDIVSKSEAATEDQRKSLTAFLDAYRSGSAVLVPSFEVRRPMLEWLDGTHGQRANRVRRRKRH